MHILLIHQAFASLDEPGGTRHYELSRYLAARGHQVTIIASPVSYITGAAIARAPVEEPSITILRANVYAAHHKSFFDRVLAFISFMLSSFQLGLGVRHVDLVWGTSPPILQGLTAWTLARLKGVPLLFEVRDLWPQFAIAVGVLRNPLLIGLARWLERFLYRHADRVMVNSPGFVKHVRGLGAKKIELVPNGADPGMFDPGDYAAAFRESHGLTGRFVALYAGAHGMSNDLGVLLEAARILQDSAREVQIVLLGDGKEKPALQDRATSLGLHNVTFLDPLPKSGMPAALATADAGIAILKPLDEYKTTYPNKVFDYMAAGRPVVLAIDGAIRKVVEAAGCGVFVPPGNARALARAIHELAAHPKEAAKMGSRGRTYLEQNFSRVALAKKLVRILEEMVS
jgi:glycosyltransferase involved in cell wall biosynthesis